MLVTVFPSYLLGYILKIESRFTQTIEERKDSFYLFLVKRTQLVIIGSLYAHIINERQHTKFFIQGMRVATAWLCFFKGTFAHALSLAFEGTLKIECTFQVILHLGTKILLGANSMELCLVMYLAVYISCTNPFPMAICIKEMIEVFAQVLATISFYLYRQFGNPSLNSSALSIFIGIQSVAHESSPLCQVVYGTSKCITV